MTSLRPEALTWTALLAKWVDFAKASLAIPDDADGARWRAVVPAVINLQAVTAALAELTEIPEGERPYARDKAEILVREGTAAIESAWEGAAMPASLRSIAQDAHDALEAAPFAGAVELVWPGPEVLVMPAVPVEGDEGTLAVMQPGTLVMPGEPVAWWAERDGAPLRAALPACDAASPRVPRQVYRQMDDAGRIERDAVTSILADPPPGLPLLVPLCAGGRAIGRFTLDASEWERRQRAGLPGERVPVEFVAAGAGEDRP